MHRESCDPRSGREVAKLISLIMLAQVCALFFRSWLQRHLTADGMALWPAMNLSYLLVPPLLISILYPVWSRYGSPVWRSLHSSTLTWRIVILGLSLGIALRAANWGTGIAQIGFGWKFDPAQVAGVQIVFGCPPLPLVGLHLLVMTVLVPLTEEVINRGLIATWLRRFGMLAATSGSAILFAVMHSADGVLNAFVFGLLAARLYLSTGSLWGPVIAHAAFNSLIVLDAHCVQARWVPGDFNSVTQVMGILGFSLAAVSYALCIIIISRRITGP